MSGAKKNLFPPGDRSSMIEYGLSHGGRPDLKGGGRAGGGKRKGHRHQKPAPCASPPIPPTGVVVTYQATEARVHLRFTGKVKWNEVGTSENGAGTVIENYEIEMIATDAAGVAVETEDGRARIRMHQKPAPKRLNLKSAKNPTGSVFSFETRRNHGQAVGDQVRITDTKKPATYNGTYTITSITDPKTFRVTGGASGVADAEDPGKSHDELDSLHVITRELHRPKTWYWKARVRAIDKEDCAGDWSAWSAPTLPWTGADPKPPVPANVILTFDTQERRRHDKLRATVTWDEVTNWDVPGGDREDDMKGFIVQLWQSTDGSTWRLHNSKSREAKDADADTTQHIIFHRIHKKYYYRCRVRSVDRFNRRGDWSVWQPGAGGATPNDTTTPPAPTNLTAVVDQHKLTVDFVLAKEPLDTDATDGTNGRVIDEDIAFASIQVATDAGFTNIIKRDQITGQHKTFSLRRPNGTYHIRVRTVDAVWNRSAWVSTTSELQPPPTPATPSIDWDDKGTRKARFRAVVNGTVVSPAGEQDDINHYVVQLVSKPTNSPPTAGDKRRAKKFEGDATGDDRDSIFPGVRRGSWNFARERAVDKQGVKSAWSAWSTGEQPSVSGSGPPNPTGVTMQQHTPRMIDVTWNDSTDEDTTSYRVQMLKSGVVQKTRIIHGNHWRYAVPKADRGTFHRARVYAIDDLDRVSSSFSDPGADLDEGVVVTAADLGPLLEQNNTEMGTLWKVEGSLELSASTGAFRTGPSGNRVELSKLEGADRVTFIPSTGSKTVLESGTDGIRWGGSSSSILSRLRQDSSLQLGKMAAGSVPFTAVQVFLRERPSGGADELVAKFGRSGLVRVMVTS